ncbi:hypothetical protein ACFL6S_02540 [Candidatus Poribacteria bacterium]
MSRKGMNRDKANLVLRLLMYFRIGLYNALWSMSQNTIMDQYGRGDDPLIHSDLHYAHDKGEQNKERSLGPDSGSKQKPENFIKEGRRL